MRYVYTLQTRAGFLLVISSRTPGQTGPFDEAERAAAVASPPAAVTQIIDAFNASIPQGLTPDEVTRATAVIASVEPGFESTLELMTVSSDKVFDRLPPESIAAAESGGAINNGQRTVAILRKAQLDETKFNPEVLAALKGLP